MAFAVAALGFTFVGDARAAVYWANRAPLAPCPGAGSIGRANLDGTLVDQRFITGADRPTGVAVNAAGIFWANQGPCLNSVAAANLDGTGVDPFFVFGNPGPAGPTGVAVDDVYVYWGNLFGDGSIGAAEIFGSGIDPAFIPGASGPCAIAVDNDHIYWANSGLNGQMADANAIGRADADGLNVNQRFIEGATAPCGVAVDSGHVYWGNTGATTIGRANLDGSQPNQSFITGAASPCGVAVDASHIYWANSATGTIGRANLDGSQVDQSFITGATTPCGVAVDSVVVQPTLPANTSVGETTATSGNVAVPASPATPATSTPQAVPPLVLSLKAAPHVRRTTVGLTLACTGAAGATCNGTAALTTTEHLVRKKVVGVSALVKHVGVGKASFTIAAGQSKAIKVALNKAGRALLHRFRRLPALLRVTLSNGAGARPAVIVSKSVTFTTPKRKH